MNRRVFPFRLAWICTVFAIAVPVGAESTAAFEVNGARLPASLTEHIEILVDESRGLTLKDVRALPVGPDHWRPAGQQRPNFGFTDAAVWVRFRVQNSGEASRRWYLRINDSQDYDSIDAYHGHQAERFTVEQLGDRFPFDRRPIENYAFAMPYDASPGAHEHYLRFWSTGNLSLSLTAHSDESLVSVIDREMILFGIYYGMMLVMVFYNLFLYYTIRDVNYLWYVGYITFTILFQAALNGLTYQYLWPDSPFMALYGTMILVAPTNLLSAQFARAFLQLPRTMPAMDKVLLVLMGLCVLLLLLLPFLPFRLMVSLISLHAFVFILTLITAGVLAWMRRVPSGQYYTIAFAVVLIGGILNILRINGLVPDIPLTRWSNQIGTTLEVVLLSLGLANRINILKQEREAAREEALRNKTLALDNLKKSDELKEAFLSNLSHELRTPLSVIHGFVELVHDGELDGESIREYSGDLIRQSQRLNHYLNDLLLVSRMETELQTSRERLDLRLVMRDAVERFQTEIKERDLNVRWLTPDEGLCVEAGRELLAHAAEHLISNAVHYNRPGGDILVHLERAGDRARLHIQDTGPGIEAEDQKHLFEKFFRIDNSLTYSESGVGLGLFLTRRIVESLGGSVRVRSTPGVGSTFTLDLPLDHAASQEPSGPNRKGR